MESTEFTRIYRDFTAETLNNFYVSLLMQLYSDEKLTLPYAKDNNRYRIYYLELLLSQDKVISHLEGNQKNYLRNITLDKINKKRETEYSPYYQLGAALILSRLIESSSLKNEINDAPTPSRFYQYGSLINVDKIKTLINLSQNIK